MTPSRLAFARAAESFVGAPFRFRGRDPQTGLDCVGLVLAALEAIGARVPSIAPYAIRQRNFAAQLACLPGAGFEATGDPPQPGDLLLLRPGPAQIHLGVVAPDGALIHAHAGLGRVVATPAPCPWPIARQWRLHSD